MAEQAAGSASTANRVVVQTRTGVPADVVEVSVGEVPVPGDGELLVELVVAPINPAEVLMFEGSYGYRDAVPPLPRQAGIEGVGRVVGGATDVVPEGTLISLVGAGPVFADYRVVGASKALVLPEGIDVDSVALTFVNAQAVLMMLHESPELQPGDWIVQNAANSAYGQVLDAIAVGEGFHVVNVVRSAGSAEAIADALGPVVIDDGSLSLDDLERRVQDAAAGSRPWLAVDAIAGAATNRLATTLQTGGRVLVYGLMSGEPVSIDTRLTVFGGITVEGFWMPRAFPRIPPADLSTIAEKAMRYVAEGRFSVPVEARYSLGDVGAALTHAARPHRQGKVVLTR